MSAITAAALLDPEIARVVVQNRLDHWRDFEATTEWMNSDYRPSFKLGEFCPDCDAPIWYPPGGGISCTECDYWFCY